MSGSPRNPDSRLSAYLQFLAGVFYYFLIRALAHHGALGLSSDAWKPLAEESMLVFLLLVGYSGMGFALNRQFHPVSTQGLPRRSGWPAEAGMGVALGWAIAVVCVVAMALDGGIAIRFSGRLASWGWLVVDLAYFALLALAEEIAFRGYAFQRFARAVGSAGAAFGFAAFYAFLQMLQIGTTHASIAVSFLLTLVLSMAYLRTRALWMSWGLNFAWKASRALIFGLAVGGANNFSPVVQGDPMGPFWLTGGGFGLEGSWMTFVVLLAALPVLYSMTRDLDFRYNVPEFIPGGIPVDIDEAARRQHESAMGTTEPPATPLVQIAPQPLSSPVEPKAQATETPSGNDTP